MNTLNLTRRGALGIGAGALAGLSLGFGLPGPRAARAAAAAPGPLNAWVNISPEGRIRIGMGQAEMGQGVYSSLPQIVADELDARLEDIEVVGTPIAAEYRFIPFIPEMFTAGSTSTRGGMDILRRAGATARYMLVSAAAAELGVPRGELTTRDSQVLHAATGRTLGYGGLAAAAAGVALPAEVPLKEPSQFRYIGKPMRRFDLEAKVTGKAVFAIDVQLPGMLTATVKAAPVPGGTLRSFDRDAAMASPGVVAVLELPARTATVNGFTVSFPQALAVVADGYWNARKGLDAAAPVFDDAGMRAIDDAWIARNFAAALDAPGRSVALDDGGAEAIIAGAGTTVSVDYSVPYLAHATMEPMSAVALIEGDRAHVWAGTQGIEFHQRVLHSLLGIPQENIRIDNVFLGGGFGRRYEPDFVAQAAMIAAALPGRPVKLIWSREEDMTHDFYRPAYHARFQAALGPDGMPAALRAHVTGQSVFRHSPGFAGFIDASGVDGAAVEALGTMPYRIAAKKIEYTEQALHIPVGWWRSVGNSQNCFFRETFIDRLAAKAGRDPLDYRRALIGDNPSWQGVLDEVARLSGWAGRPRQPGRGYGLAMEQVFGSNVAQVADVTVQDGRLAVNRVFIVVDCGQAVNPDGIEAQMHGAMVFGLSAALAGKITIREGRVEQTNFDGFFVASIWDVPEVETSILQSGGFIGGLGEACTAQIAPAIANAVLAATGTEVNALPFSDHFKLG